MKAEPGRSVGDGDVLARRMLIAMIVLCGGVEIVLQLGDLGLLGVPRLRGQAYEYGGFWSQLLHGWRPNYAAQPFTMFLTYAILHGGLAHLIFNMIALWSLGRAVADRAGPGGLATIYVAGAVGGAAMHGLLSTTLQPMVGASGALFGLAGALVGWGHADRRALKADLWPIVRAIGLLLAINVAMWWALDGQLAWQAHLGGFVAGWIAGRFADRAPPATQDGPSDP